MKGTSIQWADDPANPVMGCDGCELAPITGRPENRVCYAYCLHQIRGGKHKGYAPYFFEPTPFPGRTAKAATWEDLSGHLRENKPWLSGTPRLIFVSDMGDALSERIPFEFLREEVVMVANGTSSQLNDRGRGNSIKHQWLWLTKKPDRMRKFSLWLREQGIAWPGNLWVGTSVTNRNTTYRLDSLVEVGDETTIRFISAEPLWGEIDLRDRLGSGKFHWVIAGGESRQRSKQLRPSKRFDLAWARKLRDDCRANQVAFFLKQTGFDVADRGKKFHVPDDHGGNWDHWPADLRVRELPIHAA